MFFDRIISVRVADKAQTLHHLNLDIQTSVSNQPGLSRKRMILLGWRKKTQEGNLDAVSKKLAGQFQEQKNAAISPEKTPALVTDILAQQQAGITTVALKDLPATPWLSSEFKLISFQSVRNT